MQVWDAINDPLIGSMIDADKRQYKRNKFLQYIWFGSIGLIVGGACCFLPFPNAPVWAKFIIFIAGYVVWDAFYTVANVPYGSLLGLISSDPGDRASLSAFRSIGSLVGNMAPMVILPMIIYDANNQLIGERVFFAALLMGFLGFLCFQFMIKKTVIRVETDVTVSEEAPKFNVLKAMANFLKNRPAVGATLAAMGMFLGQQGAATAVTVMFQSYFKNAQISGLVSMFAMIPILLFTPLARKMVNKYGKKELATVGANVIKEVKDILPTQQNSAQTSSDSAHQSSLNATEAPNRDYQTYSKWSVIKVQKFTQEEIDLVDHATVVETSYGASCCFFMKNGHTLFIPMSTDAKAEIGDPVNLNEAEILTLHKHGETNIMRIRA